MLVRSVPVRNLQPLGIGGAAGSQVLEKEVGKPLKKDQTRGVILE